MTSILSRSKSVFNGTNSNASILEMKNIFRNFFLHFQSLHKILKIYTKKMISISGVYQILQTAKRVVT